jgi:sn1-specific diacylglycerol lipase
MRFEMRYTDIFPCSGKHDQEIFESYAFGSGDFGSKSNMSTTALLGSKIRMPRFWVVTDHDRKEVVLVLRGEMKPFNK